MRSDPGFVSHISAGRGRGLQPGHTVKSFEIRDQPFATPDVPVQAKSSTSNVTARTGSVTP